MNIWSSPSAQLYTNGRPQTRSTPGKSRNGQRVTSSPTRGKAIRSECQFLILGLDETGLLCGKMTGTVFLCNLWTDWVCEDRRTVAPLRTRHPGPDNPRPPSSIRALADQAFSRAAGAPLIAGNSVRPLKDARENYPAWLDAIAAARNFIHFESYIIHDDEMGRRFAAALA